MMRRATIAHLARRATIGAALAITLAGAALVAASPASADPAMVQPSFRGDCRRLPPGSICLEFADGYVWAVEDTIIDWGANHGTVQMAYGLKANYAHALGTEMTWTLAK